MDREKQALIDESEDETFWDAPSELDDAESEGPSEPAQASDDHIVELDEQPSSTEGLAARVESCSLASGSGRAPRAVAWQGHRAAFDNDVPALQAWLVATPKADWTMLDLQGNTVLHVAVLRRAMTAADKLIAAGFPDSCKNARGWTALEEAAGLQDEDMVRLLYQAATAAAKAEMKERRALLLASLHELPDYHMTIKWELGSNIFGILLRRYAPHDTYTVWKRGTKMRIDGTLMGIEDPPSPSSGSSAAPPTSPSTSAYNDCNSRPANGAHAPPIDISSSAASSRVSSNKGGWRKGLSRRSSSKGGREDMGQAPGDASSLAASSVGKAGGDGGKSLGILPEWKRGHFSLLVDAGVSPMRLLFVNHGKKSVVDLGQEHKENRLDPEEQIRLFMHDGGGKTKVRTSDVRFKPVKSWLGYAVKETVDGWSTQVYELSGKIGATAHIKATLQVPEGASYDDYLKLQPAEDNTEDLAMDTLSLATHAGGSGRAAKRSSSGNSTPHIAADARTSMEHDLAPMNGFGEHDNQNGQGSTDKDTKGGRSRYGRKKASSAGDGTGSRGPGGGNGAPAKKGQTTRRFSGRCWMASEFPMGLRQLMPLLEVVGHANKHMKKVAKFLQKYGDLQLFPVKVQVPLMLTVYLQVSNGAFWCLGKGPGGDKDALQDAFYAVPPDYTTKRLKRVKSSSGF